MTAELKKYLNNNRHLIEQEDFQLLQDACSGELRKELKCFLLDCTNNDTKLIVQASLAKELQYQVDKNGVDAFVIHLVMYQPHRYEGNRFVGDFAYTLLMNGKIIDDVFEYDVVAPNIPRATAILQQCGEKFAQMLKEKL